VRLLYGLMMVSLLLVGGMFSSSAKFTRHSFIVIEKPGEAIEVKVGDMIEITTPMFPLIPENLGKKFEMNYDQKNLRLIGELPPGVEGVMGREYYFKAVFAGTSFIEITVTDGKGEVLEKYHQDIVIKK